MAPLDDSEDQIADSTQPVVSKWNGGPEDPDGEVIQVEGTIEGTPDGDLDWWIPLPGRPTGQTQPPKPPGGGPIGDAQPFDKSKIPKGEDCSLFESFDECIDCCDRNLRDVWGAYCNKLRRRAVCWRTLMTTIYPACVVGTCGPKKGKDPIILTRETP